MGCKEHCLQLPVLRIHLLSRKSNVMVICKGDFTYIVVVVGGGAMMVCVTEYRIPS
jgi:hypothetical protein